MTHQTCEQAWAEEIKKRVAAARAGKLSGTDWRTVLDRVEKEVLGDRNRRRSGG